MSRAAKVNKQMSRPKYVTQTKIDKAFDLLAGLLECDDSSDMFSVSEIQDIRKAIMALNGKKA